MTLFAKLGSPTAELTDQQLREALIDALDQFGSNNRVAVVPPDFTRRSSRAGDLTCMAFEHLGDRIVDIVPAVGTHEPMSSAEIDDMFPGIPNSLFRYHDWRRDVDDVGTVPADFVASVTEGIYTKEWPAQLNRRLRTSNHDLILSVGQVVPHEVIGMANYNKNLFVGTGGVRGINESHYIGAAYGIERIMGEEKTPLRKLLNYAQDHFCSELPLLFVQTVIDSNSTGEQVVRGMFIGDDVECFHLACELSKQVNVIRVRPIEKAVVYLDAKKFKSTWIGNKAIYRTRMAMADGGELIIIAPGVRTFGEDSQIDAMIRKYGYRPQDEVAQLVATNADLANNLAAAAHLSHSSPGGRFQITYAPGMLSQEEIEGVGYQFASPDELTDLYRVNDHLRNSVNGWKETDEGTSFYFIRDPAMALWKRDD